MNLKRLIFTAACVLLVGSAAVIADPNVCGNIDYDPDGMITVSDFVFAVRWLWEEGPPPPDPSISDWDNHQLLTMFDLYRFVYGEFLPSCPATNPPLHIIAQPHAGLYLHTYQTFVPPYSALVGGQYSIDVYITTDSIVQFSEHSFAIKVGATTPSIQSLELAFECNSYPVSCAEAKKVDTTRAAVSFAWFDLVGEAGMLEPGRQKVATVTIAVDPSQTEWEPITIHLDSLGPVQDGYFVHQNWSMPHDGYPVWQNSTAHFPCVGVRGNINGDPADDIDISDLTYLVNYMFGVSAVEPPLTFEEVDIDANLNVDVGDLTGLVSYMFKGGPAPAMCPN